MGFVKLSRTKEEYAGESITESISREDGNIWDAKYTAKYTLYDGAGAVLSSSTLDRSADNKSFILKVPKSDTVGLDGLYLLLVDVENSDDVDIKDVIAEYSVTFTKRQG